MTVVLRSADLRDALRDARQRFHENSNVALGATWALDAGDTGGSPAVSPRRGSTAEGGGEGDENQRPGPHEDGGAASPPRKKATRPRDGARPQGGPKAGATPQCTPKKKATPKGGQAADRQRSSPKRRPIELPPPKAAELPAPKGKRTPQKNGRPDPPSRKVTPPTPPKEAELSEVERSEAEVEEAELKEVELKGTTPKRGAKRRPDAECDQTTSPRQPKDSPPRPPKSQDHAAPSN